MGQAGVSAVRFSWPLLAPPLLSPRGQGEAFEDESYSTVSLTSILLRVALE
jgi:hypothetical protein